MRVSLFVTCLVDQLYPEVGVATVDVLRRAGCEVHFDPRQTCCGQPAFNTGYRADARAVACRCIELFEEHGSDAVVSPSGSCTAMLHHFAALFPDEPDWRRRAETWATRTHELSSFLVNVLGIDDIGASFEGRVAWHDACHAMRDLGQWNEPRQLLRRVRGLELVELADAGACCGFGGTFSVKYPEVSTAITDQKIVSITQANVDAVVSGDVSCMMQIGGRLSRINSPVRVLHLAELLAARSALSLSAPHATD